MRPWAFPVALDPTSREPLFLQIARAITTDIRRGRLRPGTVLPGSRTLARTLAVHRNTVLASYRELQEGGWIVASPRAIHVSQELPARPSKIGGRHSLDADLDVHKPPAPHSGGPSSSDRAIGFDVEALSHDPFYSASNAALRPAGALSFGAGLPDLRLLPVDLLARAYRRALRTKDAKPLTYGDAEGDPRLRATLATLLSDVRGLACVKEDVVVTSGSQMALDLIARTLIRPGDVVAVEDPGYSSAWDVFRFAGAELVPIPVDAQGLSVDALARLTAERKVRAVYVTPHHQFPTTVTMAPARRLALLELARIRRMAVVEDDYDFEFHYSGRPVVPLAGSDDAGVVIYVGTLSKILSPGLRIGFLTGPRPLLAALAVRRSLLDRQGDHVLERAVSELLDDGLLQRHVRKMRRIYETRRDVLVDALRRELGGAAMFDVPAGGMSLWVRFDPSLDVEAWSLRLREQGVYLFPGIYFDFRCRNIPFARLGFSRMDERELREGVRRMAATMPLPGRDR